MPFKPTTFDELRDRCPNERDAVTVAAVLPNLPAGESLIVLHGNADGYETDRQTIEDFRKRHTPIRRGSHIYRVEVDVDGAPGDKREVTPVPHPRRSYHISVWDFRELQPTRDTRSIDFDSDQTTLSTYGSPSPFFNTRPDSTAYDRKPHLPV